MLCARLLAAMLLVILASPAPAGVHTDPHAQRSMEDGLQAFQRGAFERSVTHLLNAATLFQELGKVREQALARVYLAEAYQALGYHRKALESLESARRVTGTISETHLSATILASLGQLYLKVRLYEDAERSLTESLRLAKNVGDMAVSAAVLNSMGNLHTRQGRHREATEAYTEAISVATNSVNPALVGRASVNRAMTALERNEYADAKQDLDRAWKNLGPLPASHDKAYDLITIGLGYEKMQLYLPSLHDELVGRRYEALKEAVTTAQTIQDPRGLSYAWGYLGTLYEGEHQYQEALELTRAAIATAQQLVAPELLYRWHWQAGRVFNALEQPFEALQAYRRAVFSLQSVRQDLLAESGQRTSTFRETTGRLYFELADLLLQRSAAESKTQESEQYLKEARDVIEQLKVSELRDYFRDDCVEAARSRVSALERVSTDAAIIYPVLLSNRTELLVSLPTGMHRIAVPVGVDALTEEVRTFRHFLEKRTTHEYRPHARRLYDWLIRPLEPFLQDASITTLVFVPDGVLHTIPMAALHDGKQFLIEKYAIATTPGITLTDPRPLRREKVLLLSGGLSESVQGFPPLPNVVAELKAIKQLYGGAMLLNEEFLVSRVEQTLKERPFSMVHIASHGEFASDVRNSFLLAFDDKLTMDRLDRFVGLFRFRDEPLALLTLSACETAVGDDRAALGLAGVAIKAGASSAVATLWFISDEASLTLVSEFYKQLHDTSVSKAAALQRAQVRILKDGVYGHPAYWAAFLLLNNWL